MAIKKEIKICDVCKNTIAKQKCEICSKDLCKNCIGDNKSTIAINNKEIFNLGANEVCGECESELFKLIDKNLIKFIKETDIKTRVKQYVVEKVLNEVAVNHLGKEGKD